jgi:hypothetical protein
MIKIIFILLTLLFTSGIFAEVDRYETNVANVYIKISNALMGILNLI